MLKLSAIFEENLGTIADYCIVNHGYDLRAAFNRFYSNALNGDDQITERERDILNIFSDDIQRDPEQCYREMITTLLSIYAFNVSEAFRIRFHLGNANMVRQLVNDGATISGTVPDRLRQIVTNERTITALMVYYFKTERGRILEGFLE